MTLSQLASFITTKLADTDSASVTICKDFINRRYQMIWDSSIWTETLGIVSQAIAANETTTTVSTAPSITFYHSALAPTTYLDFPVAAKFTATGQDDGLEIIGNDWISFFGLDANLWNDVAGRRANPTNWVPLPKDGSGYMRLRLMPTPDTAGTLFCLGKLKWVQLGDSDTPALRGVENALLAFAEGDMLERSRQSGKAQLKYTEAAAQIQIMRDLEKGQQQLNSQIVPSDLGDVTIDHVMG